MLILSFPTLQYLSYRRIFTVPYFYSQHLVIYNNTYTTKLVGSRSWLEVHDWGHLKKRLGITGLGGLLMQERNGKPQPIAYASRLCTAAEKNYSIMERETLAVIYCLEHFRDMILGYLIRVWTDHTAIQNLFKHKNLRGRLAQWFVILQSYEVT